MKEKAVMPERTLANVMATFRSSRLLSPEALRELDDLQHEHPDPQELVRAVLARLGERKRKQALRGLELLAEAAREMVASGELSRLLKRGAA